MDTLSAASSVLSGWQALLRQASFKGAAFKVETSDLNSGRRNAVHEYPQKDKPYLEGLGGNTRELRVEGWVIGENYAWQRDALLAVIESLMDNASNSWKTMLFPKMKGHRVLQENHVN